jgi:hypothetical protein
MDICLLLDGGVYNVANDDSNASITRWQLAVIRPLIPALLENIARDGSTFSLRKVSAVKAIRRIK